MPLIFIPSYSGSTSSDPYRDKVPFLLYAEGPDGSKSLYNSGTSGDVPFTFTGNTKISTANFKFGGSSIETSNGFIWCDPVESGTVLDSGDFTIEAWVYPRSNGNCAIIARWENQSYIVSTYNGKLAFSWAPFSTTKGLMEGGTVPLNTWTHIAVTRKGNTWRQFVNGVLSATAEHSRDATPKNSVRTTIGSYSITSGGNHGPWNGFIDELRVTKGVCRYEGNFVPPTGSFD